MALVSTKFPIFDLMKLKQGSLLICEDPVAGFLYDSGRVSRPGLLRLVLWPLWV